MDVPSRLWRLVRRILMVFAALVLCGALLLGSLWLEHSFSIELPKPTGPFAVGRDVFDWVDGKTLDSLAPVAGTKRELLVWMWFPASIGQPVVVDDYLPGPLRDAIASQSGVLLTDFLTRDLSKVRGHSLRYAVVLPQQQSYHVLIMRAGASLEVASYSSLAEDLASHGYVVVGVDAPYRTGIVYFPDGRIIKRVPGNNPEVCLEKTGQERDRCATRFLTAWNSDIAYVLDRLAELNASDESGKFTAKLDITRVGIFGHSLGERRPHNSALATPGVRPLLIWTALHMAVSFRQA